MVDKLILKFSSLSSWAIVVLITFFVLLGSVPAVYFLTYMHGSPYTMFLVKLSIVLPLLLTPPVIYVFLKLSKHMKYIQNAFEVEIEKNRKKDVLLFEQAKFTLMGEMIANISHQWKQPLHTISLALISSRFSYDNQAELEKNFNIVDDNVKYLSSTIDDFLSFFDKRTNEKLQTLDAIIKQAHSILGIELQKQRIKLNVNIDTKLGELKLKSSLSQVILNLLSNAKDALVSSDKKDKIIDLNFVPSTHFLEITCCDNGISIDEAIKEKIFMPYFTTKDKNRGTGIGLYMSKQIINKVFNGDIYLDTNEQKCFHIEIPYSDECKLEKK